MALPIPPNNSISGSGDQQMKAVILGWIRDEIARASQGGAGLHVDGATRNLIIDQGEVQSGNYVAGSAGWALKPTGDAEFSGNVAIEGTLSLPAGIINNAALASPVVPGNFDNSTTGWAPTAGWTTIASATLTVPAGFTKAAVTAFAYSYLYYTAAGSGIVMTRAVIGGAAGDNDERNATNGVYVVGNASSAALLTGLTGGNTFTAQAQILAGAMTSDPTNFGHVYGIVQWFR